MSCNDDCTTNKVTTTPDSKQVKVDKRRSKVIVPPQQRCVVRKGENKVYVVSPDNRNRVIVRKNGATVIQNQPIQTKVVVSCATAVPVQRFLDLVDTPNSYENAGGEAVLVKPDGSGLEFGEGKKYIFKVSHGSNGKVNYFGRALPGTDDFEEEWMICRFYWHPDLRFSHMYRAEGNANFDKKWNQRETYLYS
jgi:hypothetical protein